MYGVVCSKSVKKTRKHNLCHNFWRPTKMQKYDVLQEQQEQEQRRQQQQQQEVQKKHKHATKRCVTSCGMKRTSYCTLHLRARAEHMNNTNVLTTIHNPYGIAGVRSSTISYNMRSHLKHQCLKHNNVPIGSYAHQVASY